MNFYTIVVVGGIIVFSLLIYILNRDRKNSAVFFGRHSKLALFFIIVLSIGIICLIDIRFVEPNILVRRDLKFKISGLQKNLHVVFISDLQVGTFHGAQRTKKIAEKIDEAKPDIVFIGGDLVSNEGAEETEVEALEPLRAIIQKYPTYYVLGNHEYGISGTIWPELKFIICADHSRETIKKMNEMGATLLRNNLLCTTIKNNDFCLFGLDDVFAMKNFNEKVANFSELYNWNQNTPLIFLTHNPDGMLYWPADLKKPNLTLAGHTHGGQIYLPFFGPLANPGVQVNKKYFRGLNDWGGSPIYTSVGLGESGGPVRFFTWPEIVAIELTP